MPMHDWTRVEPDIYHAFDHELISEIHRAVLRLLPPDYYSLPEPQAAGFGPDVLTLKSDDDLSVVAGTATKAAGWHCRAGRVLGATGVPVQSKSLIWHE